MSRINMMLKVSLCLIIGNVLATLVNASEVVVTKSAVIRDGPHGYSTRLATAVPGDRFELQKDAPENNWYSIDYQGVDAWIYFKWVNTEQSAAPQDISIASFNTLHLGWGSDKNFEIIASILSRFDLVALQEVMKEEAVATLVSQLESIPSSSGGSSLQWDYIVSDKLGTTKYKESYAFIWKSDRISLIPNSAFVHSDENDEFIREPYVASFKAGNIDFMLISAHFVFGDKLKERQDEARAMAEVYSKLQQADSHENDLILLGDFNLPPTDVGWQDLKDLTGIAWVLNPPSLTTVGKTGMSSLYDNIWFQTQFTPEFAGTGGSYEYMHDFFETDVFESARQFVSDHVPVYAVFRTNVGDDD